MFLMPLEVAGWVLRLGKLQMGDWVLVVSTDVRLPVGLLMRGPEPMNVTLGLLDVGDHEMERVQQTVDPIKGNVRQQTTLRLIRWGGGQHLSLGGVAHLRRSMDMEKCF